MSDMIRMSIDVPANLHRFVKMKAASRHQTIRAYVIGQIARDAKKSASVRKPDRRRKPNRLTHETIEKSLRGKELVYSKNLDEFFRTLDI